MPICPKCKAEIDFLHSYNESKSTMEVGKDGKVYYEPLYEIDNPTSFECPECCEELFKWEGQAEEFLKNEDELQQIVKEKIEMIEEKT